MGKITPAAFKGPTREDLLASVTKKVPDVIAPGLNVLFCGINPGLYSAWTGFHFARPGNRFWPALHAGGFTERVLHPSENRELLRLRLGITNLVQRATAAADELFAPELISGRAILEKRLKRYRPRMLAVLGLTSFRTAFGERHASIGLQSQKIHGALVWVLPNPSGLNAHFTPAALGQLFEELRRYTQNLCIK